MIMDMVRLILAIFRVAYLPKIGRPYYYSFNGPFGATLRPLRTQGGFVEYQVEHENDIVTKHSTSFSTWALMAREYAK